MEMRDCVFKYRFVRGRGLSLAEALVAILFLVVGLGAIMQLFARQTVQVHTVVHRNHAERLAQNQAERLSALGGDKLSETYLAESDSFFSKYESLRDVEENGANFWRVFRVVREAEKNRLRLTIWCGWEEQPLDVSKRTDGEMAKSVEVVRYVVAS